MLENLREGAGLKNHRMSLANRYTDYVPARNILGGTSKRGGRSVGLKGLGGMKLIDTEAA